MADGAGAGDSAGPLDRSQPGAEWVDERTNIRYRRARNGQLQEHRLTAGRSDDPAWAAYRWVFVPDPSRPADPASVIRAARKKRAKAGLPNRKPGDQKRGTGRVPFAVSPEDRLRLKLREKQRNVYKDSTASTKLTPTLAGVHALSFATRYIDGGRATFIEAVQLAVLERCPAAEAWFAVYADLLPYEREIVSFDDVCAASGVKPSQLMAEVVSTVMEIGRDAGNLIAALMHPKVIGAMAESGADLKSTNPEISQRDRMAFLQGRGFLPVPKNAVINVHASASAQAAAAAASEPSVPSFAADLGALRPRQLPTADPALDPVTAPATADAVLLNEDDD